MKDVFKDLKIIQEKKVPKGNLSGYFTIYERLNPYNPLSYITLILAFVVSIVLYGLIGTCRDLRKNPFKWR